MRKKSKANKATWTVKADVLDFTTTGKAVFDSYMDREKDFPRELLNIGEVLWINEADYLEKVGKTAADEIGAEIGVNVGYEYGFDSQIDFSMSVKDAENFVRNCKQMKLDPIAEIQKISRNAIEHAVIDYPMSGFIKLSEGAEYLFEKSEKTFDLVREYNRLKKQGQDYIAAMNFTERAKNMVAAAMKKINADFRDLFLEEMENYI